MQKIFICSVLIVILIGLSVSIFAQDTLLDPVTVTSSLIERRSSETGRDIIIMKGDAFRQLPVHSLDELLKYIPGVEVQMRGPQGSQSDISIRGATFQQVLVIVDGLRLNDPNTGHFSAYIPISPAEIDRIEVLKGASSAIYGSDAVGGVINIITKTFATSGQADKLNLDAQAGIGEYGLINANAGAYYQSDKIKISGGIISNNSNGVVQRGTRGFFHNTTASASVGFKLNDHWNMALRSTYDARDFAAQNFYTSLLSDTARENVSSWWYQARVNYRKGKNELSLDAGYKRLTDDYLYNPGSTVNNNVSSVFQTQLLYSLSFNQLSNLIAGINFQHRKIVSNDRGDHVVNITAPFLSYIQKAGEHFTINPSLRLEYFNHLSPELVPQLNISYKKDNLQLRTSGGKTIRNADFTELYNNYNKDFIAGGRVGNPSLAAEKSWSYEAGADWFLSHSIKLSSTFFQRFHTELIDWVSTAYADMPRKENLKTDGTFDLAKNISSTKTSGWESSVTYFRKFSELQSLQLNTGFVWMYSSSDEDKPSFYILSHARFVTNFNLLFNCGPISISTTGIYKVRNPQSESSIAASISKDYFLLNGRINYTFYQKLFSVFLQADNIFNRSYSDLLGTPMPGRWLQGGIHFMLKKAND